ncbi:E3 binding domain-containing protein [Oscillibacter ruminantium]|jgi:pyruvate/2-oxoglutarate dehydrogenase complex dihydrolipoamide acyltransferase (E2) component|uniref:E3 binding domain-containing protein n=1 Tax=Oscillibacter ruminantium TaxID=1263547 RepID=UPI0002EFFBFB|nr:E3 binding domain-containing protein [Oscillibacter ruminantium]
MAEKMRLHVSPYARKTARELGVVLETLTGSGPNGRIVWRDVDAAAKTAENSAAGGVAGYYTTVDVRELLAALKTLDGALTFPAFAQRAAERLSVPVRFAGDGIEGALPVLNEGETAAMTVGDPTDGHARVHLAYDSGAMSDEAAAKLLRSMKGLLEKPLTMLT